MKECGCGWFISHFSQKSKSLHVVQWNLNPMMGFKLHPSQRKPLWIIILLETFWLLSPCKYNGKACLRLSLDGIFISEGLKIFSTIWIKENLGLISMKNKNYLKFLAWAHFCICVFRAPKAKLEVSSRWHIRFFSVSCCFSSGRGHRISCKFSHHFFCPCLCILCTGFPNRGFCFPYWRNFPFSRGWALTYPLLPWNGHWLSFYKAFLSRDSYYHFHLNSKNYQRVWLQSIDHLLNFPLF